MSRGTHTVHAEETLSFFAILYKANKKTTAFNSIKANPISAYKKNPGSFFLSISTS
ncbi:hypothetical protein MBAV_004385 [Candidatus Magnetobacterium bavaricum]|uniref:Uncharacterized protein n=1 Tax=Candidatus Magnetobacterium bavaricum TaxID=29290 RepID=A0A0F3GRT7_9BACT|nr:hypothetical protein MBAV_004385 [Candidatus Magnetobacterium bavaricum]